jgi:hypothetical protein
MAIKIIERAVSLVSNWRLKAGNLAYMLKVHEAI